jgi:hypothetical protein
MAPGYYPDVPQSRYGLIDAWNFSTAKVGLRSMAHMRHHIDNPSEVSEAMLVGQALHLAIFEPGRFAREVVVMQDFGRTRAELEAKARFLDEHRDRVVLKEEKLATVSAMAESVLANPQAAAALARPAHNEATVVWVDQETGIKCKGRLDRYLPEDSMVLDLKSCRDGSRDGFARAVLQHHYGLQAAWYLEGIAQTRGDVAGFTWLTVENTAPFVCTVYEVDDCTLEHGRAVMRKLLRQHAECLRTGVWPGYATKIEQNGIPTWALARASDEVNSVADSAAMEGVEDEQPI